MTGQGTLRISRAMACTLVFGLGACGGGAKGGSTPVDDDTGGDGGEQSAGAAGAAGKGGTAGSSGGAGGSGSGSAVAAGSGPDGGPDGPAADVSSDTTNPDTGAPAVGAAFTLELPGSVPPGVPFPILVSTADGKPLTTRVEVTVGGEKKVVELHRGRGSVSFAVAAEGSPVVKATAGTATAVQRTVIVAARPKRMLQGTLSGKALQWDAMEDIVLTGNVVVPAGAALTVAAGTRVLGGGKANLDVAGSMAVNGTAQNPVLFTRVGTAPWGGVRVTGKAELHHVLVTQGGGDETRSFGHMVALQDPRKPLPTQALLLVRGGDLLVDGGAIVDSLGKGPSGEMNGVVTIKGVLISRVAQGGETHDAQLVMDRTHILEIPKTDGVVTSDDADGYHLGPPRIVAGKAQGSFIRDSVVAFTEDDGIDHNATDLTIERVWIENTYHEGIAVSEYGNVIIRDAVVTHSGQGLEVGWGKPIVDAKNLIIAGCGVGLRWGDDYDWDEDGVLKVSYVVVLKDSLVAGPVYRSDFPNIDGTFWDKKLTVWNYGYKLKGPNPGGIDISCSMVQSPDWDGKQNNAAGAPVVDAQGCVEAKMLSGCPDGAIGTRTCF